jgi:hypothetical protein
MCVKGIDRVKGSLLFDQNYPGLFITAAHEMAHT